MAPKSKKFVRNSKRGVDKKGTKNKPKSRRSKEATLRRAYEKLVKERKEEEKKAGKKAEEENTTEEKKSIGESEKKTDELVDTS